MKKIQIDTHRHLTCCKPLLSLEASTPYSCIYLFALLPNKNICMPGTKNLHLMSVIVKAILKADFMSWQKLLASSLLITVDKFPLLSSLQPILAAWLKNFQLIYLLFTVSKCQVTIHRQCLFKFFKMAERLCSCSG